MTTYGGDKRGLSAAVWVLVLAASLPLACVIDHFAVRKYAPWLHDCGTVKFALALGQVKLNIPGEWGILVLWAVPLIVASLLAIPSGEKGKKFGRGYGARLSKIVCAFIAVPLGLVVCAVISPLIELKKIPVDYLAIGFTISSWGNEVGEVESSLILALPVCYLLHRSFLVLAWKLKE